MSSLTSCRGCLQKQKNNLCFRSTVVYAGWGRDEGKFTPEIHLERASQPQIFFACCFYSTTSASPIPSPLNPASDFVHVHVHVCDFGHACYPKDLFQSLIFLKGLFAGRLYTWKIGVISCSGQICLSPASRVMTKCNGLMQNMKPPGQRKTYDKTYIRRHI